MAIIFKPGQKKKNYEIIQEMNRGAFAIAYEAKTASGEHVFFKQYKSPSRLVEWYDGFVEHQKEIKRRIESNVATKDRCYRFVEFFEDGGFFQVFEFVDGGKALSQLLSERSSFTWEQIVVLAKVMMFGIKSLHEINIIHTDLKPDNVFLIPDTIDLGFRLKIIDLDWSIFADRQAPWHGKQGYIGSPGYQSTEHILGMVPLQASDIFTSGIILGEMLSGKHPFAHVDNYEAAIVAGHFNPIKICNPISKVNDLAFLEAVLNSCLNPDPVQRPTASQICDALIGKTFSLPGYIPKPAVPNSAPPITPPPNKCAVEIRFNGKDVTTINANTAELGKQLFKSLHADAQYLSNPQFRLSRKDGGWVIEHCETATNETVVDGVKLVGAIPARDGMRVEVGNTTRGIVKFPLHLRLVE